MSATIDFKRLRREDMQDAPAWFDAAMRSINTLGESVSNSLNGNIGSQNLDVQSFESDTGRVSFPLTIQSKLKHKVERVTLSQIYIMAANGTHESPASPLSVDWNLTDKGIVVYNIVGRDTTKKYFFRLKVE